MGRSSDEIEGVRGELGLNGLVLVLVLVVVLVLDALFCVSYRHALTDRS